MPHLTVNGVTFPGQADTFGESGEFIGDVMGRSQSGSLVESRITRKRRWRVRSTFVLASEAEAWRRLLEGDGHNWTFAANAVSSKGLGPASGGTWSISSFSPPSGVMTCVTVNAGSSISWDLGAAMGPGWSPSRGFAILVYRQDSTALGDTSTGFFRYLVSGSTSWTVGTANPTAVTQLRDSSQGSYGVGRWMQLTASGRLSIYGFGNSTGAANTHSYAMLTALPFGIPSSSWLTQLADYTEARRAAGLSWLSANPRVVLAGDAIPDPDGVEVVARVGVLDQRNVRLSGAHRNTARILEVEFTEV